MKNLINDIVIGKTTVKILDLETPNRRRIITGRLVSSFDLDWTKPLDKLEEDIELALRTFELEQGSFKKLIMFKNKKVGVYRGGHHIDIIAEGKGRLHWLFVGDEYVYPVLTH